MATERELIQLITLIENETQNEGNTKERVGKALRALYNVDTFFKKVAPNDPEAKYVILADGSKVQLSGGGFESGTLTDNQFTDANGEIIEAEESKLYLDTDSNLFYRYDGTDYILLNPAPPAPKKPFATTFAEFPDTPDLNDIIHLLMNDDENIPTDATPLTAGKETAGYWRFDGTNWIQLLTTNTASGSAFL